MSGMILMNKDTKVIKINLDESEYDIITPELVPYQLQGKLSKMPIEVPKTQSEIKQYIRMGQRNYEAVIAYAASRVLPLTRKNAKKIYQLFGYEQLQDVYSKAKIAFICKAVSLQDNYWFKSENDTVTWKDVDLRNNSLNEIVAQVALYGTSLSLTGSLCTPELNGQGAYAKAWKRENGELWLYKMSMGGKESEKEVMVSKLLDKCSVEHARYFEADFSDQFVCKCKCMTTENLSILPGMDFISYCNTVGLNPDIEIMKIDKDSIYKMWIVDFLISNGDRHGMNWGFYYDANSMKIVGCHPLFDHNEAFDEGVMENPDIEYLFNKKMTMREAAKYAIKRAEFYFTDDIKESDFLEQKQYHSFMERADELGIVTKKTNGDFKKMVSF